MVSTYKTSLFTISWPQIPRPSPNSYNKLFYWFFSRAPLVWSKTLPLIGYGSPITSRLSQAKKIDWKKIRTPNKFRPARNANLYQIRYPSVTPSPDFDWHHFSSLSPPPPPWDLLTAQQPSQSFFFQSLELNDTSVSLVTTNGFKTFLQSKPVHMIVVGNCTTIYITNAEYCITSNLMVNE